VRSKSLRNTVVDKSLLKVSFWLQLQLLMGDVNTEQKGCQVCQCNRQAAHRDHLPCSLFTSTSNHINCSPLVSVEITCHAHSIISCLHNM